MSETRDVTFTGKMYGEIFDPEKYKIFKDSNGPPGDTFFDVTVSEDPETDVSDSGTEDDTISDGDSDDLKHKKEKQVTDKLARLERELKNLTTF